MMITLDGLRKSTQPPDKDRSRRRLSPSGGVLLALLALAAGPALAGESDPDGVAFYEKNVRPLLIEHCYACHSAEAKGLKGNLRLDRPADWLKGGDLGPAVVPGDLEESLLISAVNYEDEFLLMPPKGKLSDRQIAILTEWVQRGAPAPDPGEPAEAVAEASQADQGEATWAFRTADDPAPPNVNDESWLSNDLDRFILARLEEQGLTPASRADRRTLIRRVTFDLTGLPPSPEEIQAFLQDESPGAFDRVVERLLASPRYGERWGRHWLDVARYADSNGLDENVAHGNAWRYRDYVVEAFNKDKPYDRFLLEQLAGDLLPPTDSLDEQHERLIATGFLTLGPKVLAEVDKTKMEMDIIDEQLDTTGRAFLGMTIGCARCHDHKFDPISAADYYALAGIFKSTRTMESLKTVGRWHENEIASPEDLARKAEHEAQVTSLKARIDERVAQADGEARESLPEGTDAPEKLETLYPEETKDEIAKLREELAALEKAAPVMPSAMGVAEGEITDIPVHIRGSHLTLGEMVHRRVPTVFQTPNPPQISGSQSGRLDLAQWMVDPDHPLTSRVMVNRVWRWHFGRGLVNTTDNFGTNGARPTHPELLDWLAHRFIENGWSIKALHRLILLSSTYQMSSEPDSSASAKDPEVTFYWQWKLQRLEAEEIRDALLDLGGVLDQEIGGSLLQVDNRAYFFDHTSKDKTGYETNRRSLYLPVVRNHLYEMFQLFDGTDASTIDGNRATTTVAPQALFMLNSDLVLSTARSLANDLLARETLDDPARVDRLYELAFGRLPKAEETERALAFVERFGQLITKTENGDSPNLEERRQEAWQGLCQVILASNEFVYLR